MAKKIVLLLDLRKAIKSEKRLAAAKAAKSQLPKGYFGQGVYLYDSKAVGHAFLEHFKSKKSLSWISAQPLTVKQTWIKKSKKYDVVGYLLIGNERIIANQYINIRYNWPKSVAFNTTDWKLLMPEEAILLAEERFMTSTNSDSNKNPVRFLDAANMHVPDRVDCQKYIMIDALRNEHNQDVCNLILQRVATIDQAEERLVKEGLPTVHGGISHKTGHDNLLLRGSGNIPKWEADMILDAEDAWKDWLKANPNIPDDIRDDIDTVCCTQCNNRYKFNWTVDQYSICPECLWDDSRSVYATVREFVNNSLETVLSPEWVSDKSNFESIVNEEDLEYNDRFDYEDDTDFSEFDEEIFVEDDEF